MIGSSDGRTYDGKQRWGVSVFDFKMPPPPKSGDAKISPVFVGYGQNSGPSQRNKATDRLSFPQQLGDGFGCVANAGSSGRTDERGAHIRRTRSRSE